MKTIHTLGCFLCLAVAAPAAPAPVSLSSLLREMVDRDAAARLPAPAYTGVQASSYDRASTSPDQPDTWWANADRSQFIRSEQTDGREEWVMMDAAGPGSIVRVWITADKPAGNVRVYLDHATTPAIVAPAGETKKEVMASFRFAARLKLDTFGFNRLCAYRGTPLWQEYVDRGIIDDERDWNKWFKCSDIDPTALSSATVNQVRMQGYAWLFGSRILRRPFRTYKLLRTFGRHMKTSDILKLLYSPFRRRTLSRKPDLPARMIELGLKEPPVVTIAIP